MKLQHNLGGLENLGPIAFEKEPFLEAWEKRIFGIHVVMMALSTHLAEALPGYDMSALPTQFRDAWSWGHLRMGAEALNPFDYYRLRYYEKWLGGIASFFVDKGYVSEAELSARTEAERAGTALPVVRPTPQLDAHVIRYLREGDSPARDGAAPAFSEGERVRIADVHPVDHTRLPGYLRNKEGVIDHVYEGAYGYFFSTGPDGIGEPMPVYSVKLAAKDIWGAMAEPNTYVYADLFEAYVRPLAEARP